MKAALRQGPNNMACRTIGEPELSENGVLVKILHVGICGSDIARVRDNDPKWDNIVLGHEAVGVIEKISNSASKKSVFKEGDKVAIIPLVPCQKCYFCKKGMYSSCTDYSFIGSRVNGALSEYLLVNFNNLIKLPDDEDIAKYTFLEPLSVAIHAIYRTDIKFGKSAMVFGAGTIGLLIFQLLKNRTFSKVIIADIDEFKLDIASQLGSLHNINLVNESLDDYIKNNTDNNGVDDVFEVSGANTAKKNAIHIVKPGGSIILVGGSNNDINFDMKTFELITRKELKLTGSWMSYSSPFPGNEWLSGIKMLKENLIDTKLLITHRFKLEDIGGAFDMITRNTEKYCKVLVDI
ncbi:MAG: galactitol-1-phosphate 5-dehydrogenase [Actinobacteria bacterium]|nr:galactitol-1-phosphate 5-dehydrogenase [Actinomycetota bacterium]